MTVKALLMASVACSFVCILIKSSCFAPNIWNTLVAAPADDVNTFNPCAIPSRCLVSEASPRTELFTSSIASRSSPAFFIKSSSLCFSSIPVAEFLSASVIRRYSTVALAISFVNCLSCCLMLSVCCVGTVDAAFLTMVGISSAFFWIALRASFIQVSTCSISVLVDSAKAVLPLSSAERRLSSRVRSLVVCASTNLTFCSLDFISTPAVSFSDTPIAFREADIFSTP